MKAQPSWGLIKGQITTKVEMMTSRDTGRLFRTLYERADDIPVQHLAYRVIFYAFVLLLTLWWLP